MSRGSRKAPLAPLSPKPCWIRWDEASFSSEQTQALGVWTSAQQLSQIQSQLQAMPFFASGTMGTWKHSAANANAHPAFQHQPSTQAYALPPSTGWTGFKQEGNLPCLMHSEVSPKWWALNCHRTEQPPRVPPPPAVFSSGLSSFFFFFPLQELIMINVSSVNSKGINVICHLL